MKNLIHVVLNNKLKSLVFIVILAFFASFLIYQITLPAAEDLPRQLQNGKDIIQGNFDVITKNVYSFTEPNQPFANHHWLYGVIFYLLFLAVGFKGIVVFKVIVFLFIFSLLFYVSTRKANFWVVAFCSIPTIIFLLGRSAARPEMFSYLFISLFLYLLIDLDEHPKSKKVFWILPLQLLWANIHLFFGVGVMLVGGFLIEKIIQNIGNLKNNKLILKLVIVLAGAIITIFITPYGYKGAIYSLTVNTSKTFPIVSAETQPISKVLISSPKADNVPAAVFPLLAIILGLSFLFGLSRKPSILKALQRQPIFLMLASAGTIFVGFNVIRSLAMFGIIFLPAISGNLDRPFVWIKNWLEKKHPEIKIIAGFIGVTIIIGGLGYYAIFDRAKVSGYAQFGIGVTNGSESAGEFLRSENIKGPIYNDTDLGSYLIYYLYPQEKVFVDNRFGDAYSAGFFKDVYLPATADEESWQRISKDYNINAIAFYQYDGGNGARDFLYRRIYDPEWAWVYADKFVVILVRNIIENQYVITRHQITIENLADKINKIAEPGGYEDIIGAADIYSLAGMSKEAMDLYLKVVSKWPERGKIWMVLGRTELTKADQNNSNPALALTFMQKAIDSGWKTPESYSYLALAYYRTGDLEKAREYVAKEKKMYPESQDVKDWEAKLERAENAKGNYLETE